jgi:hypothetical protein
MSLLPFVQWCDQSALGLAIHNSRWLFPAIEVIHLLALGLLGGTVLIVDLGLWGIGLRRETVPQIARDVYPWMLAGLAAMLLSGMLLFLSEALKMYHNDAFRAKMVVLAAALVFTFTVRRRVTLRGDAGMPALRGRLVAAVSLALWTGVGLCGRAIGFV